MPEKKEVLYVCEECLKETGGKCTANHADEECIFDNKPKWRRLK